MEVGGIVLVVSEKPEVKMGESRLVGSSLP